MLKARFIVPMLIGIFAIATPSFCQGNVAKGKVIFDKMTCAVCHPGGGNTIDKSKALTSPSMKKMSEAQICAIIRNGVKGTAMPAFGKDKISDAAMKDLVAYIRSLK
jgi:mono/diheme cytochrome c family protein